MPTFRIAATVNAEQLATLLLAAKAADVSLELGVATVEPLPRRKSPVRRQSIKKRRPKRYKASMQVRMGPEPLDGPPRLIKLHRVLKKQYGEEPFRKGEVRERFGKKFKGYSGSMMTALLDKGSMIPA